MTNITQQPTYPCSPIDLGKRIEKSRLLLRDLEEFDFNRSEKNILIKYIRSDKPLEIIIPTCPDYISDSSIDNQDSVIIGSSIPQTLEPLIYKAQLFSSILSRHSVVYTVKVLLANPRYGGMELVTIPNQQQLISDAYASTKELIKSHCDDLQFPVEVATFEHNFGSNVVQSLESKYTQLLNMRYKESSSFQESVERKIDSDKVKIRLDFLRALKMKTTSEFDDFAIKKTIRGMAESLALADTISKKMTNPIIVSTHKRDNATNRRNRFRLPEYGSTEQNTIPIFTNNIKPL